MFSDKKNNKIIEALKNSRRETMNAAAKERIKSALLAECERVTYNSSERYRDKWFNKLSRKLMSVASIFKLKNAAVFGFFLLILALAMLLGLPFDNHKTKPIRPLVAKAEFSLKPDKSDSLGIAKDASFTLTALDSNTNYSAADIKSALEIKPDIDFKVEKKQNGGFTISPDKPLAENAVYSFSLAVKPLGSSKTAFIHIPFFAFAETFGNNQNLKTYSWAFQVKSDFKVLQTLPRDKSTHVLVNTGIEIRFSSENIYDYEKYFEISPNAEGRFEQHRNTLVFVPKELQGGTVYTVSLKKDLPIKGSEETLKTDYQFQFETADLSVIGNENYNKPAFARHFFEFRPNVTPYLETGYNASGELPIVVYRFNSFEEFTQAAMEFGKVPQWAFDASRKKTVSKEGLTEVARFTAASKTAADWRQYIEFPETLPQGYYLAEMENDIISQALIQVGNLSAYLSVSGTKTLIWAHEASGNPSKNADYSILNSNISGKINKEGTAVFDTPQFLKDSERNETAFLLLVNGEEKLLQPLESNYFNYSSSYGQQDYWNYFSTDRTLYLPTDTIHFWGTARKRNGGKIENLQIKLIKMDYSDSFSRDGKEEVYAEKSVAISNQDIFTGEMDFKELTPSYGYELRLYDADQLISTVWMNVETYQKPSYYLKIVPEKAAVYAGEKAVFNVTAKFYDQTPVANLKLKYNGNPGEGSAVTDAKGHTQLTFDTNYNPSQGFYPESFYLTVFPDIPEQASIQADGYVSIFNSRINLELQTEVKDGQAIVTAKASKVDLNKLNNPASSEISWNYNGVPAEGVDVSLVRYEVVQEKRERDTYYDFISKTTEKSYYYERKETELENNTLKTDQNGQVVWSFPAGTGQTIKISASAGDSYGRSGTTTTEFGGYYQYQFMASENALYLETNKDNANIINSNDVMNGNYSGSPIYNAGEQVQVSLKKGENALPAAKNSYLFFTAQGGIRDIKTADDNNWKFDFKESYVPNVYVTGVFYDGTSYQIAPERDISFNKDAKKLDLRIQADKEYYSPGEKANLDVSVTNKDGKPEQAEVNLSVIDQALDALQYGAGNINLVDSLYQEVSSGVIITRISPQYAATMFSDEGGGCFTGKTDILMAGGGSKKIKDVTEGDIILAKESANGQLVPAKVTKTYRHLVSEYLVINGFLEITPVHVLYVNGQWQTASQIKPGDRLMGADGLPVTVVTVETWHSQTRVYNLTVENYHTYIADGIYVHNSKGGRELMKDLAFYGSAKTDKNGKTSFSFNLPDNITSWKATAAALTLDYKAGSKIFSLIATKPFFVTVSSAASYLSGDRPIIKISGYGKDFSDEQKVEYQFSWPDEQNMPQETKTGKMSEPLYYELPELSEGKHRLRVAGEIGDLEDALILPIEIKNTNLTVEKTVYLKLSENAALPKTAGRAELAFDGAVRGKLYVLLKQLSQDDGDRLDQVASRDVSDKLLNQYFGETNEISDAGLSEYLVPQTGGYAILPYASADPLLTAKMLELSGDQVDRDSLVNYFNGQLDDENLNAEEISASLYGMALLDQPVLTDINVFIQGNDLSAISKLYLAMGLSHLGDGEGSRRILNETLSKYGEKSGPLTQINLGDDKDDNIEATYYCAILAERLGMEESAGLWNYAIANMAKDNLNSLEKINYLSAALPYLAAEKASFTYNLGEKTEKVELDGIKNFRLSLLPSEMESIRFSGISGEVAVTATYTEPLDPTTVRLDSNVNVQKTYTVNGKQTMDFSENDLVKVTITPRIAENAIDSEYQITDVLPAGLKFLSNPYSRMDTPLDQQLQYPYEINGQTLKFWSGKPARTFTYYAYAANKGVYLAEPALIQGFKAKESLSLTPSSAVVVIK